MTKAIIRYLFMLFVAFLCTTAVAQNLKWRDMYQVKKKDTIFGIAKNYGLTVDELINANPEMKVAGYELKKATISLFHIQRTQIQRLPRLRLPPPHNPKP